MAVEAFTLLAILRATDEASKIIDKVTEALNALGGAADRAAASAAESSKIIDESLLQTASGADAVSVASARLAAAESKVNVALGEQAAAERDLLAARASGASDDVLAAAADRLAVAERNAAIATREHEAAQARYDATMATAIAVRNGTANATSRLTSVSAAYASGLDKAWNVSKYGIAITAAVGYESVKTAAKFQQSMTMIRTQAHDTTDNINQMGQELISLAPKVGKTPDELAQGLYHITSAGIRGAHAMDILKAAVMGAQMGNADLEDTTQAMIAIFSSGIGGVKNMQDAMAQLNAVVGTGDMRMGDLAKAMGTGIMPSAKQAGLSLIDVGAAMATLTDNATKPIDAANRLRMSFSMMASPTQAAQKAFAAVGLKGTQLAEDMRKPDGLLVALEDLKKHLSMPVTGAQFTGSLKGAQTIMGNMGLSADQAAQQIHKFGIGGAYAEGQLHKFGLTFPQIQAAMSKLGPNAVEQTTILARAFGGGRTSGAILTLMNELDKLKGKYPAIRDGAKDFQKSWEATTHTAVFQANSVKASVSAIGTAIGTALLPVVQQLLGDVVNLLGPILAWVQSHQKLTKQIFEVVLVLGGLIGYMKIAMGIAKAFTAIMALLDVEMDANPIGLVVAAIGLLVIAIIYAWNHFSWFRTAVKAVWDALKIAVVAVVNALVDTWHWMVSAGEAVWQALIAAWDGVVSAAKAVWGFLTGIWNDIVDTTVSVWNGIVDFFKKWWPLLLVIFMPFVALIIGIWNHFHKQIIGTAKTVWNAVKNFFVMIWHGIESAAVSIWHMIYNVIVRPIEMVWNFMKPIWSTIGGWMKSAWNGIKAAAVYIWGLIKAGIINPIVAVWNKISEIFGKVASYMGKQMSAAWNAIKSVVGKFWEIGKDIVMGIINGISNAAGSLFSSLKNLASNALNAAKSLLGIGSPSKVFANEIGKWIPHGIAKGITDHAQVAHEAVSKLAKGLPGVSIDGDANIKVTGTTKLTNAQGLAGPSLASGAGRPAGYGVYIDMRGSQLMSEKDYDVLADRLGRRIATRILPAGGVRIRM